jgi:hypothetical protein
VRNKTLIKAIERQRDALGKRRNKLREMIDELEVWTLSEQV